jgi:3-hydroxy-9,10-secoandrosta-1,3,5(10)-triene-9,17-dione monooxygenase
MSALPPTAATGPDMIARARALASQFAERAAAAEDARRISPDSARDMLDAGLARILIPREAGGMGLGLETWFDVTREIARADASHGWCAGLLIHHAHLVALFAEAARNAVWASGPDVPVAVSLRPVARVEAAAGGYRVTSDGSPFMSGIDHCTWVMISGRLPDATQGTAPEWGFFLLPPGAYTVRDTWFTNAMRATGSKTAVVDGAFVPEAFVLRRAALRDGRAPGAAAFSDPLFRTPYSYYAPIAVIAPMLGVAEGAYERFIAQAKGDQAVARSQAARIRLGRAAADLDAAGLLARRAVQVTGRPQDYAPGHLTRSLRDFARIAELTAGVVDTLLALGGTAGFDSAHPLQRAWRDIHFMARHAAVNPDTNYDHFGAMAIGAGRPG